MTNATIIAEYSKLISIILVYYCDARRGHEDQQPRGRVAKILRFWHLSVTDIVLHILYTDTVIFNVVNFQMVKIFYDNFFMTQIKTALKNQIYHFRKCRNTIFIA